jgi:apolipoprotein N-acyltransferase
MGLLFATVWLCATFWWLYVAMHTYGGLNGLLAALAIVLLAAALAIYYALVCAVYVHMGERNPALASLAFSVLWTFAEMARGIWLTGFGWGAVGYAHIDGPLSWYIPWVGAYGVGAMAAWLAMTIALARHQRTASLVAMALVLAVPYLVPTSFNDWTGATGELSVTLLQGNIPQDEKFETGSGVPLALTWYGEQLQASTTDVVVTPETAIPVLPQQLPNAYWMPLEQKFAQEGRAALIGMPLGSHTEGFSNSVVGLQAGQSSVWRYDKHHLVPFGEFIPPMFKWFTAMMHIPLGDFNRGALGQASFITAKQRLALNICYEDLFGEELGTRFTDSATAPTIFVNVSNIAWFGDTVAIDQHLQISRMRVLEFQRPFVRATNTGATVILDHHANVVAELPRHTRGALMGVVQGRQGITPFAWWVSRAGLWPLWIAAVTVIAWMWLRRRVRLPRLGT